VLSLKGIYCRGAGLDSRANGSSGIHPVQYVRFDPWLRGSFFSWRCWPTTLNCWLMLFNREEHAKVETVQHTTLATAHLRFLFLAAKIWRHAGRVGVRYSDHYAEQSFAA
jgi:hypothetical protein